MDRRTFLKAIGAGMVAPGSAIKVFMASYYSPQAIIEKVFRKQEIEKKFELIYAQLERDQIGFQEAYRQIADLSLQMIVQTSLRLMIQSPQFQQILKKKIASIAAS